MQEDKEVSISINMSMQIDRKDDSNEAVVGLKFELGEKGNSTPFYICI